MRDLKSLKAVASSSRMQSNLLVDIYHIYLAGRTLQRPSQGNHSLISLKSEWQSKQLHVASDKYEVDGRPFCFLTSRNENIVRRRSLYSLAVFLFLIINIEGGRGALNNESKSTDVVAKLHRLR
ncbi:unnamed protein product [Trichobilharzia regenti]|nr:unnamed protein product [Trichobilharzia regenti]